MATLPLRVRPYRPEDEVAVIELWRRCSLLRAANDPRKDIARKLADSPETFLVGTVAEQVVATAMTGYDGHRGWINYLAIDPEHQKMGLGKEIMSAAEGLLRRQGCPKINVQVRASNTEVLGFYRALGFTDDPVVSLGKRLVTD